MNWLNRLRKPQPASGEEADRNIHRLYVRCNRCGATVAVRINLMNDPSHDYEAGGFVLNKEIMDSRCYQLMYASLHLDDRYNVTEQTITNGTFITREEFLASQEPPKPTQEPS